MIAIDCIVKGVVQGVGFRPFVYRLAVKYQLKGWVQNNNEAVYIHVEGKEDNIANFCNSLKAEAPEAAVITSIDSLSSTLKNYENFSILPSNNVSEAVTRVSPDIAVCEECLSDLIHDPNRLSYPLVNCCHCGPRFSIIQNLPYDRQNTTMKDFDLCNSCREEYNNPSNRRFHAQPVSCNKCGPKYFLHIWDENNKDFVAISEIKTILKVASEEIKQGKIFALKGVGGYNLICDALNEEAVKQLRMIKRRESKPFAVMFKDIERLKYYVSTCKIEENELKSFRRPIVILKTQKSLAPSVSMGFPTTGAMLPVMPFHFMLLQSLDTDALVMTSGNLHDEPIIIDDEKALETFGKCTAGVISYNRTIYNRVDDSVEAIVDNRKSLIRRARGYVPEPKMINDRNFEGIFAAGAEMTGTFAIGKGNEVILSQYFGDLKVYENYQFYQEAYDHFCKIFRFKPTIAVTDLHPDYFSTVFAHELNIPVVSVQHHHAHIASVMAENSIRDKVIGVAMDGTGLGPDNTIWGGEFLICSPDEYVRYAHFQPIPLPGGDKVIEEPWRTAVAYLYSFDNNFSKLPFISGIGDEQINSVLLALQKNINCPLSSGAGRLFDAVAVLLGLGIKPSYHAELPSRLENLINPTLPYQPYSFQINNKIINFSETFNQIIEDLLHHSDIQSISKRFHDTVVAIITKICEMARSELGINRVALSGGIFQNAYLLYATSKTLEENNFEVYSNHYVPANDAGIALGQMYILASKI
jgi:hydrogenase maturation protein HypF